MKSALRDALPVLVLLTLVFAGCAYFLVVDDFDADTGPILDRSFGCMLAIAAAIAVGSGVAASRPAPKPFARGLVAGAIGVVYLIVVLLVIGAGEVLGALIYLGIAGLVVAAVGAVVGLILRGP